MSVTAGILVLAAFESGDTFLGNSTSAPSPWLSIATGLSSMALGWLMASRRGQALLDRWRARRPRRATQEKEPSWAERHLDRANARVAFVVGAAINLPGPFYLLALGDIASSDYSDAQELGLILLFNAIMFLLVELPLVGYLVRPDETARLVAAFASWLNANGLRVMGCLVSAVGLSLVVQGIAAASG